MIVTEIKGGLGNQLFQYAYGYSIAVNRRTAMQLDLSWFKREERETKGPGKEMRKCELLDLNIVFRDISLRSRSHFRFSFFNRIRNGFLPLRYKAFIKEPDLSFRSDHLNAGNESYLSGFWQTPLYFEKHRAALLQQFTPKGSPDENNLKWLEMIAGCNSVAIHIRRGDYVKFPELAKLHGVLEMDYYDRAMSYMKSAITDPIFFLFTDDWQWAQSVLPASSRMQHVRIMSNSAIADLQLMRSCKHQIVANSTFSWWGAWLNDNTDKIVAAPTLWYLDPLKNKEVRYLVPDSWVRI